MAAFGTEYALKVVRCTYYQEHGSYHLCAFSLQPKRYCITWHATEYNVQFPTDFVFSVLIGWVFVQSFSISLIVLCKNQFNVTSNDYPCFHAFYCWLADRWSTANFWIHLFLFYSNMADTLKANALKFISVKYPKLEVNSAQTIFWNILKEI